MKSYEIIKARKESNGIYVYNNFGVDYAAYGKFVSHNNQKLNNKSIREVRKQIKDEMEAREGAEIKLTFKKDVLDYLRANFY